MKTKQDKDKAVLRKIFNLCKKNAGEWIETFEPVEGVTITIEYILAFSYFLDYQIIEEISVNIPPKWKKFNERRNWLDIDMLLRCHLSDLENEFDKLTASLENEEYFDFIEAIDGFNSFENFWNFVCDKREQNTSIQLNDQYSAKVNQGSKIIEVGCQKFSIDKIRSLVETWDEINSRNKS